MIKIHGEIICQICPLLTQFYSGPIVRRDNLRKGLLGYCNVYIFLFLAELFDQILNKGLMRAAHIGGHIED